MDNLHKLENIPNNLNPIIWGGCFWTTIYNIALGYPTSPTEEDKINYIAFFTNIKNIIPCNECRNHYNNIFAKEPITNKDLCSRKTLILWIIKIHNSINSIINKKTLTVTEIENKYIKPHIANTSKKICCFSASKSKKILNK